MLRYFPGMYVDENIWVREGETVVVSGTDSQYFLKNEQFFVDLYDEDDETFGEALERAESPLVKTYQTDAVLYTREQTDSVGIEGELTEVARQEIRVNEPLKYEDFALYQLDYKLNELKSMTFTLEDKDTGETFGEMTVDLNNPNASYELGDGYSVEVAEYFPNYFLNDDNVPSTRSKIPDNPAFIFNMFTPETPDGETSFVGIQQNLEPLGENQYKMTFLNAETNHVTGLVVRKDHTLPVLIIGGIIFMIGLVQGSYWPIAGFGYSEWTRKSGLPGTRIKTGFRSERI